MLHNIKQPFSTQTARVYHSMQNGHVTRAAILRDCPELTGGQVDKALWRLMQNGRIKQVGGTRKLQGAVAAATYAICLLDKKPQQYHDRISKMAGQYIPAQSNVHRPGAMDAFSIPSRGF